MNVLVTGATGFIGSHLVRRLLSLNHDVTILIRKKSNTWRIADLLTNNKLHIVYLEKLSFEKLFADNTYDALIHLAAHYIKKHTDEIDINSLHQANIIWPANMLYYASKRIPLFINTGTCFEYAQKKSKLNEHDPIEPYNYYAVTKCAFEQFLSYATRNSPLRAVTLKLFYPYGEMDNTKIIPLMIRSILANKPLTVTRRTQAFSYTYVADIVDAYIKVLTKPTTEKYRVFNIGTKKGVSLKQIYATLVKISDIKKRLVQFTGPLIKNDLEMVVCDGINAEKELGFTSQTSLVVGLEKTYNFYRKNLESLPQ